MEKLPRDKVEEQLAALEGLARNLKREHSLRRVPANCLPAFPPRALCRSPG